MSQTTDSIAPSTWIWTGAPPLPEPKPYVFRVRVPITRARSLRRYLWAKFPVVLTDESRSQLFWSVFTVEAPPEMMAPLRRKIEARVGGVFFT